ncbi:MAG: NADH-quinone oxidoreductase subunit A [Planctomycetaceae bacterium]|nr:NADH-quinone oxidoreductase subunit A [Planctomycetaceae bacterium]
MTDLVGHFLIFTLVIVAALAGPLVLGRLVRPHNPTREKLSVYECGEPTIGSSHVQFDLRFYVVALLFIVFDIEVAFFFPWSVIYGNAIHLSDERLPAVTAQNLHEPAAAARMTLSETLLSVPPGSLPVNETITADAARTFAWTGLVDVLVFFAVLLVGFAYVWKRGDLDWVRAVSAQVKRKATRPEPERVSVSEARVPVHN